MRADILKRLTDYWSEKRAGRRMPLRSSIDPTELAELLPNLVMVEALDDGGDYMHRIAGEEAEKIIGADLHGKRLSSFNVSRETLTSWRNGLDLARAYRAPHFANFERDDGKGMIRVAFLPLSGAGGDDATFVLSVVTDRAADTV